MRDSANVAEIGDKPDKLDQLGADWRTIVNAE